MKRAEDLAIMRHRCILDYVDQFSFKVDLMDNSIWIAFMTGLTTGGLSCMAVQGGLVTGSLANQLENELLSKPEMGKNQARPAQRHLAQPIMLFLLAKLAAYTLLGFGLGFLGSTLSLTPTTRGILQLAIGLFMIGNALRMLNIHPIFRYFSFEPPAFVRRFIRRQSSTRRGHNPQVAAGQNAILTPLFLGLLTVFIPCGVAQSMMAVAVSTGSPMLGALILFAFTLGASPVFFILTYLATRLSALMETYFMRIVAAALLVLGLIAFDAGLNLVGAPFSFSQVTQGLAQNISPTPNISNAGKQAVVLGDPLAEAQPAQATVLMDEITIHAEDSGYSPQKVSAPADKPVTLHLVTNQTRSCSRAFMIPALDYSVVLPESGEQNVSIPAQKAGTQMRFSCSMGMYTGVIRFQ